MPRKNSLKPLTGSRELSGNDKLKRDSKRAKVDEQLKRSLKNFLTMGQSPHPEEPGMIENERDPSPEACEVTQDGTSMLGFHSTLDTIYNCGEPSTGAALTINMDNGKITESSSQEILETAGPAVTTSPQTTSDNTVSRGQVLNSVTLATGHGVDIDVSDPATWPSSLSEHRSWLQDQQPEKVRLPNYPLLNGRRFSNTFFEFETKLGGLEQREWLIYSKSTNSLFCFPCCLFGKRDVGSWGDYGKVGYQLFCQTARGIDRHQTSLKHFDNSKKWLSYRNRERNYGNINTLYEGNVQKEISLWTDILKSIFEVVKFLAKNNLPFRGSSNTIDSPGNGLFLNLLTFISNYHPPLKEHLNRLQRKSVSYLSSDSQNEFISLIGKEIRSHIFSSVRQSKYFSISFDSTPDSSKKNQISQCIRTVVCEKSGCRIEEHFIDFLSTNAKTGKELADAFLCKLQDDGLDMTNCRGQAYDNEAKMSGAHQGVQKWILDKFPDAEHVPCTPHSLNLVGKNVCARVEEANLTMGKIQNVYNYFSASAERWSVLLEAVKITLKCQNEVRWSCRWAAVDPLYNQFAEIIQCLKSVSNSPDTYNDDTVAGAVAQLSGINNFRFLLALKVWHSLLHQIEICNKLLQSAKLDAEKASKLIKGLLVFLEEFRKTGYRSCFKDCVAKAKSMSLPFSGGFSAMRSKREVPCLDDALSRYKSFEINYFNVVTESLINEFGFRFNKLHDISERFSFLWGKNLLRYDGAQFEQKSRNLAERYPRDLTFSAFYSEVLALKSFIPPFLRDNQKLSDLTALDMLNVIHKNVLMSTFPNVDVALRIFLTLPISIVRNEASFSKLKLIKNFLRSSMGQDRLSNLAIISIEKKIAEHISFDDFIVKFATAKVRRIKFV